MSEISIRHPRVIKKCARKCRMQIYINQNLFYTLYIEVKMLETISFITL